MSAAPEPDQEAVDYPAAAARWLRAGWSPLPLPEGSKWPPPDGYTGRGGADVTVEDVKRWRKSFKVGKRTYPAPGANTALRLSTNVVGIDVDVYGDKHGDDTLAALEDTYGALPATIVVTSRGFEPTGSGIRLFRLPTDATGTVFPGVLGPGIEVIQHHHRYVVAPGSNHPEGGVYAAYEQGRPELGYEAGAVWSPGDFTVDDLAELPFSWLDARPAGKMSRVEGAIDRVDMAAVEALAREDVVEWLAEHGDGNACRATSGVLNSFLKRIKAAADDGTSRYDTAVEGSWALLQLAVEGHRGVRAAVNALGKAYARAVADEPGRDKSEWARMVVDGVSKADALLRASEDDLGPWEMHERGQCPDRGAGEDGGEPAPDVWPSPSSPLDVAARYVAERCSQPVEKSVDNAGAAEVVVTLKRWRGEFYRWAGRHYEPISDEALGAELAAILRDVSFVGAAATPTELRWNPTPQKITNVLRMLPAVPGVLVPDGEEPDDRAGERISLRSGVLDVASRTLTPHTPARFSLSSLPFDYDPDAECPSWLEFLASVWPDERDADCEDLLAEWMGYVMSGRTNLQKIALLIGPPRCGKGTIGRVLAALMGGAPNVCFPTLSRIGGTFGLQQFLGTSLAVVGDAESSARAAASALDDLKSISGEDSVTVQRKNRDEWSGRLGTRFMLMTNNVPSFLDTSGAFAERLLPLKFTRSFAGQEDVTLSERLLAPEELAGVLRWALDGLDRLNANGGRFTMPRSSTELKRALFEEFSPITAFLNERCVTEPEPDPLQWEERGVIYDAYVEWCGDTGRHHLNQAAFGRDLRSVLPNVMGSGNQLHHEGKRIRVYYGVWLKDDVEDDE